MNRAEYTRRLLRSLPLAAVLGLGVPLAACEESSWEAQRLALARAVEKQVRETADYTGKERLDPAVLEAIRDVPRHEFVPPAYREYAYEDRPLPIGEGQTISQPYIVALMTDLASVGPASTVLEVGTGSGYQAAVLAGIAEHVYTIEIVAPLGERAAETLERLGYDNVSVRIGDGYRGWPEAAPFDAIVVTAAPETVPPPLIEQLKVGGRLVIPVGPEGGAQFLEVFEKRPDGSITSRHVLPVRFVPFTRDVEQ
ncbi:protein-L-isoaspartate(D-aspartate) O-methyltransferase [Lentisalinibacter salinarum]|uniref:protein-L-isoaspartate(D-aspartate) O-methyltransferase n=1 Tax=Lentisalinibacter salinarum TaxID=2992239 RepID=UPI0038690413